MHETTASLDHGASFLDPPPSDLTPRWGSADENSSIITHKAANLTSVSLGQARPSDDADDVSVLVTDTELLSTLQSLPYITQYLHDDFAKWHITTE